MLTGTRKRRKQAYLGNPRAEHRSITPADNICGVPPSGTPYFFKQQFWLSTNKTRLAFRFLLFELRNALKHSAILPGQRRQPATHKLAKFADLQPTMHARKTIQLPQPFAKQRFRAGVIVPS